MVEIIKPKINWNQDTISLLLKQKKKLKKNLQYLLLLKKYNYNIDYKNIILLKAFLTKDGKIVSRRKTQISLQLQHRIAKAIKKARMLKLIPFICSVIQ